MSRRNRDRKRRNRETRRRLAQERMPVVIRRRRGPGFRALQVEKGLEHFTVMLALATGKNTTANDVVANGTGTLVNSGQKPLIITNHHVYNKFKLDRASDPHAKLIMSGAHGTHFVDISEAECLGTDKDLDLAVLSVPPMIVFNRGKLFLCPEKWPPPRRKGHARRPRGIPGRRTKGRAKRRDRREPSGGWHARCLRERASFCHRGRKPGCARVRAGGAEAVDEFRWDQRQRRLRHSPEGHELRRFLAGWFRVRGRAGPLPDGCARRSHQRRWNDPLSKNSRRDFDVAWLRLLSEPRVMGSVRTVEMIEVGPDHATCDVDDPGCFLVGGLA